MLIAHESKALRDRFFEAGPTSLPDLEILELFILGTAPPRCKTIGQRTAEGLW